MSGPDFVMTKICQQPLDTGDVIREQTSQPLVGYVAEFTAMLSATVFSDRSGNALPVDRAVPMVLRMMHDVRRRDADVYLIGNGGSAAVASHIANDFCNTSSMRASTLHDPALLTCFTNDYGYDKAYALLVERMARPGDLLIAISSSGQSSNILMAVEAMHDAGGKVVTMSGFDRSNHLRKQGDFNAWAASSAYGLVEIGHLLLLHYLVDQLAAVYKEN